MKICFRLSELKQGGTERVFLSLGRYFQSEGWEVDFVVDRRHRSSTEAVVAESGMRLVDLDCHRTWKSIFPFARYLRHSRPDWTVSAFTDTNGGAVLSSVLAGRADRLLLTEHASIVEHWRGKSRLRRFLLEAIVRALYPRAAALVCVSKGMLGPFARRLGTKLPLGYIHNPVRELRGSLNREQARAKHGIGSQERVVLAVGRISAPKNYPMLLEAFAAMKTPSSRLVIVGSIEDENLMSLLRSRIHELGLASRVTHFGFTESIGEFYQLADVFALSSSWEGFGNVIVEAMSMGVPIVSTNCNHGPDEILDSGRYGELVEVGDAAAMGEALDRVLAGEADGEILKRRAEEFSEATIGRRYIELLTSLEGERRA